MIYYNNHCIVNCIYIVTSVRKELWVGPWVVSPAKGVISDAYDNNYIKNNNNKINNKINPKPSASDDNKTHVLFCIPYLDRYPEIIDGLRLEKSFMPWTALKDS